ncbi:hypothetical protein H7E67_02295 [Clostridium gasigenes]|uniref:hypothetical protein n=1 Tax=Clostridium gasigenes TaxID=94869 RepID=UPI0016290DF1|nr:hypothetical protein [Clostridium gasigenes]MBB6622250.1 hypothetical protein [Clostridium gasigenes]
MEVRRKSRAIATDEDVKRMIELRKKGRTYEFIGEKVGLHYTTVHRYVKDVSLENREVGKPKYDLVVKLLGEGKTIGQAANIVNTSKDYIRKINRTKDVEKIKRRKEEVKKEKTDRQKQIEEINKEIKRQKESKEEEWQDHLKREKEYYKERYSYVVS